MKVDDDRYNLYGATETWLASGIWLILVLALLVPLLQLCAAVVRSSTAAQGPTRTEAAAGLLAAALLFAVALYSRLALPFIPLHANLHAWEDLAVVLDLPSVAEAVGRHLNIYGAAWLVPQRALLHIFGAHFDGVAMASAWWGASAVVLAAAAALGAGGSRLVVLVVSLAMVWAPVTAMVAHSESDLVVGQWLLAAGLWLATRRGKLARMGLAASVALLALGHVVGPLLGLGLVCFSAAIRVARIPKKQGFSSKSAPSATTGRRWKLTGHWRRFGALVLVLAASGSLRMHISGAHVSDRLARTGRWLPIPSQPWKYSLWLFPDYAATGVVILALLALIGTSAVAWRSDRWRGLASEAGLGIGLMLIGATGLLVCASISDGLRYQAVLMAPMTVVAGRAVWGWRFGPPRWRRVFGVLCVIAMVVTGVELVRGFDGRHMPDSQAQEWLLLRAALSDRRGPLRLMQPQRVDGKAVVFEVPQGRWSAVGPESFKLTEAIARLRCKQGKPLWTPAFVMQFAACSVDHRHDGALCKAALRFADRTQPIATHTIELAQRLTKYGLQGEFLDFSARSVPWQLFSARCPAIEPVVP